MKNNIEGNTTWQCGDINLAAALMSQEIPLDAYCPVSLIDSETGQYSSFRITFAHTSGGLDTEDLMDAWAGKKSIPKDHGFSYVCQFIRARPRGIQSSNDLLDFAVTYLTEKGHKLPGLRTLEDIPAFVNALPNSEASYVLAYINNRDVCFQLHKRATRKSYLTEGSGSETRHALLDTQLPKWQARELLSRLQG